MKALLLVATLFLSGCGAALHTFDTGVEDPVHSPWARAQAKHLAPIYGTDPDLSTRFLPIGPQGGWSGWYDGFRITVCLYDEEGNPRPDWRIHNIWHHEWNHHRHGGIRWDSHEEEYRLELAALGLLEHP